MAIFFGSPPISLIADKVTFFLGFDALYLYLKFNSFAIFAILFFDGLLLIRYKEKSSLDSMMDLRLTVADWLKAASDFLIESVQVKP